MRGRNERTGFCADRGVRFREWLASGDERSGAAARDAVRRSGVPRAGGADHRVLFLQRHGENHRYPPHAIPYAANLWALREAGATDVFAVGTVGAVSEALPPGAICIPDDLVDRTWGRQSTFYTGPETGVQHVDFTHPFSEGLRQELIKAALAAEVPVMDGGVYWCTQGPRLETAAEVRVVSQLGGAMIGMTACPEAAVAREAGLRYALLGLSVNWAAGISDSKESIDFESIKESMERMTAGVREIIRTAVLSAQ